MVRRDIRNFGRISDVVEVPDLIDIQRRSYARFIQVDVAPGKRKAQGLEGLLREIFPIISYDKTMVLEYLGYELEKARYTPQECRELRLTYGHPLKIRCQLKRQQHDDIAEQAIYLGEIPIMIGGGEFIINGAERVIVNQLHRSPGVDFMVDQKEGDRILHGGRIIPERGSWIEMAVTKKDRLVVRIDQSSKIPATIFLRAMSEKYGKTEDIIRLFYKTKTVKVKKLDPTMWTVGPVVDTETGEVLVEAGSQLGDAVSQIQGSAGLSSGQKERITSPEEVIKALLKYKQKEKLYGWFDVPENKEIRALLKENPLALVVAVLCMRLIDRPYEDALSLTKGLGCLDVKDIANKSIDDIKQYLSGLTASDAAGSIIAFCKLIVKKYEGKVETFWKNRTAKEVVEEFGDLPKVGKHKLKFLLANMLHTKSDVLPYAQKFPDPENIGISADTHVLDAVNFLKLAEIDGLSKDKTKQKVVESIRELYPVFPGELDAPLWKLGQEFKTDEAKYKEWLKKHKLLKVCKTSSLESLEVIEKVSDPLILLTLAEDVCESHEDALLRIYARLRPGNPSHIEKARTLFKEKFYDCNRYRLGKVGRFRLNRKFKLNVDESEMSLRPEDFLSTMQYIIGLRNNVGSVDDIDHLGNRRLRTVDELAADEVRKGLLKLRRTVQERMSMKDPDAVKRIADLVNSKSVSSSIEYFFGRGELSQVVDQTNALSQLTHERRLSALGPGGLNRKRAGFEVRDVHISHYGRVCPIETPEGTNIGLIVSLAIFSKIDEYGFLITPYRVVKKGKVTDEVVYLRADQEMESIFAPPSAVDPKSNKLKDGLLVARREGDLSQVTKFDVNYVDVSPKQIVGVSASLIPFLEHDDANRALMGSNMMRQAVPLLITEPPLVGTGMESSVAQNSSMVVKVRNSGTVTEVDSEKIVINDTDEYLLKKFQGLNERTCLNQKPLITVGEKVKKDQIIADGGGTSEGVLALGRNVLVAFVTFDGYNFEDAILVSERLVKDDVFTSIHIDEFSVEIRETKLGREEFTRDIPNVSEKALCNLDENGVICGGTRILPGDILVGKVSPKSKTELTPEEKLLHAIFGRAGEDVKNDSLEVPSGYAGVVIKTKRFTRRGAGSDEQKQLLKQEKAQYETEMTAKECAVFRQAMEEIHTSLSIEVIDPSTRQKVGASDDDAVIYEQLDEFDIAWVKPASVRDMAQKIFDKYQRRLVELKEEKNRRLDRMKHGDELPSGVLEMVKVYVATKRTLSIGDKMAGRHGNKGVIAKIMPEEDMPFLEDGTPVDICLNPLGVPSRMNVGQILETLLGWTGKILGYNCISPVFDGATEEDIHASVGEANAHVRSRVEALEKNKEAPPAGELFTEMPESLKTNIFDGRTGEPFAQDATIGYIYMMKLHHLVDDKIHARATGPYSLITQQPLGGKARTGGQRFGEMEVWALEAYGAAYTLQELLTVKSDDIEGRTKIYESMVKGTNTLEAGTPISFDVLCNEIRGLGLNIQLEKKRVGSPRL